MYTLFPNYFLSLYLSFTITDKSISLTHWQLQIILIIHVLLIQYILKTFWQ